VPIHPRGDVAKVSTRYEKPALASVEKRVTACSMLPDGRRSTELRLMSQNSSTAGARALDGFIIKIHPRGDAAKVSTRYEKPALASVEKRVDRVLDAA